MHLTAEPRRIDTLRPSVPSAVARVLERALAKRPQDRYESAVQFAEALTASVAGGATPTRRCRSRRRCLRTTFPASGRISSAANASSPNAHGCSTTRVC